MDMHPPQRPLRCRPGVLDTTVLHILVSFNDRPMVLVNSWLCSYSPVHTSAQTPALPCAVLLSTGRSWKTPGVAVIASSQQAECPPVLVHGMRWWPAVGVLVWGKECLFVGSGLVCAEGKHEHLKMSRGSWLAIWWGQWHLQAESLDGSRSSPTVASLIFLNIIEHFYKIFVGWM